MENKYTFLKDFNGRYELKNKYKDNALLLYALQLRFDIEDIDAIAADALTDGADDKKCDLIFIDRDLGISVIAQAYNRNNPSDTDLAKENKACDLNTAAAWVFSGDVNIIPKTIKDAVIDLQAAIDEKSISTIYFWYVHNLNENNNPKIKQEMHTLQAQLESTLAGKYPEEDLKINTLEVGLNTIEKWYENSNRRIAIEDNYKVIHRNGFEIKTNEWRAFVTAVSGKWLRDLYIDKGDDLFFFYLLNYIGQRQNNINKGIIRSVKEEPGNFWAYNNGITALVNDFDYLKNKDELEIKGITIINGAQTTGAIGTVEDIKEDFYIPCRFIVCNDKTIIESIINNNNKQNEILPSDLRSNDKQQERLRNEFKRYNNLFYNGGRRDDKIRKNRHIFDPYLVGQTLLAFHGDCVTAYNGRKRIWQEDKLYAKVFIDQLTVEHIVFVYSLSKAIDDYKNKLRDKNDEKTSKEKENMEFLSKRGAKMLLIATISECLEDIIGKKIVDKWNLSFITNNEYDELIPIWENVVVTIIAFNKSLLPALDGGLKNKDTVNTCVQEVKSIVSSVSGVISQQVSNFIENIKK